jgi:hypothetical protein
MENRKLYLHYPDGTPYPWYGNFMKTRRSEESIFDYEGTFHFTFDGIFPNGYLLFENENYKTLLLLKYGK